MRPSHENRKKSAEALLSTREVKRQIAIQWNSSLFFQLGLIVSLLMMIWIVQQDWKVMARTKESPRVRIALTEPPAMTYSVEQPPVQQPEQKEPPQKTMKPLQKPVSSLTAVSNKSTMTESKVAPSEPDNNPLPEIRATVPSKPTGPTNVLQVEEVPIFPGCNTKGNKKERLACFQEKIQKFVGKKFRTDAFVDRYPGERKQIHVMFTIDEKGKVTDIKSVSKGADDLAQEATRVIGVLPQMIPGKQNSQPVRVVYTLPITISIDY